MSDLASLHLCIFNNIQPLIAFQVCTFGTNTNCMKRWLIVLLLIMAFLLVGLLGAPLFLKQRMHKVALNTLENYFNGNVEIEKVELSVWEDFPNIKIGWEGVLVSSIDSEKADSAMYAESVRTTVSASVIFFSSFIDVASLEVNKVQLNLDSESFRKGRAQPQKQKLEAALIATNTNKSLRLKLEQMSLHNVNLRYTINEIDISYNFEGIEAQLSGEMSDKEGTFKLITSAESFYVEQYQKAIFPGTGLKFETGIETNSDKQLITFKEGEIQINKLPLLLEGSVSAPSDSVFFDLNLQGKESGFENIANLFEGTNQNIQNDLYTEGDAVIEGKITGYYFQEDFPSISLSTKISDASLKNKRMPAAIENLKGSLLLEKPQGTFDAMKFTIRDAHAEIGENPLDFSLDLTNILSDPFFDAFVIGKMNLGDLQQIFPLQQVNLYGDVDVNLQLQGAYSDIIEETYSNLQADGVAWLNNFRYSSPKLSRSLAISEAKLDFSSQKIAVQKLAMRIGQSDFLMSGQLQNHLSYVFNKGTLKADLRLTSEFVNFNELFLLANPDAGFSASAGTDLLSENENLMAFKVPSRVDFQLQTNIKQAIISTIPIEKVSGAVHIKNEELELKELGFKTLGGAMLISGTYKNEEQIQPSFNFDLDITNFDIPTMAQTLNGFQKMLPGAQNSSGSVSAALNLNGNFDGGLELIPESTNGKGSFTSDNLVIVNSPLFRQLGGIIKKEELQRVNVDNFTAQLQIENGNLKLLPFQTRVIGQPTTGFGNLSADNQLEMRLDFIVERNIIGPDIQRILAVIPGNEKIKELPAGVNIKGPVEAPVVSPDLSATSKAVTDATKDDLKNSLDKIGKGILKLFEK